MFRCRKCGLKVHLMTFGYGKTICPSCYEGEEKFIFFDEGYWLNRLLSRMHKRARRRQVVTLTMERRMNSGAS